MTTTNDTAVDQTVRILELGGAESYGGEAVSQLEHALQCATLAEQAGQNADLITACLLHDLGHLLHHLGEDAADKGIDDTHENRGASYLASYFGPAVTEPIRLHVAAKRYLCRVDTDYWAGLSSASKKSLELQGGIFSTPEASTFIGQPYAPAAVQLRIWDDEAKVRGLATPDLAHFTQVMRSCIIT